MEALCTVVPGRKRVAAAISVLVGLSPAPGAAASGQAAAPCRHTTAIEHRIEYAADHQKPISFYPGSVALLASVNLPDGTHRQQQYGGIKYPIVARCDKPSKGARSGSLTNSDYLVGYVENLQPDVPHFKVHLMSASPNTTHFIPAHATVQRLRQVIFPADGHGGIALGTPEGPHGNPLLDSYGHPLTIGQLAEQ